MQTDANDQRQAADRRGADRRQHQITPLPFPDRRKASRRSGIDRRTGQSG